MSAAFGLLGHPGLDNSEGPGHHLQFVRAGCVLDVYYYPDPAAGQPTARYAEARGADGKATDAVRCFAAQAGLVPGRAGPGQNAAGVAPIAKPRS